MGYSWLRREKVIVAEQRRNNMANFRINSASVSPGVSWYFRKRDTIDVDKLREADDKTGEYTARKFVKELATEGTVQAIADADIIDFEVRALYGKRYLSGKENTLLMKSIHERGNGALSEWGTYLHTYDLLREYANKMVDACTDYERDLTELAGKCELWESHEQTARELTRAIDFMSEEGARSFLAGINSSSQGVRLRQYGKTIVTDVSGEGMLYEQIEEIAREVRDGLSVFKAYEQVLYSLLHDNGLEWMLPFNIENILVDVYSPRLGLPDSIPSEYFRGILRRRALDGEDISEEDELRAVIPDYAEVEADRATIEHAISFIKTLEEK